MAASNDDSATLARPNPTGDHVDEIHKPQRENASERELFTLV